MQYQRNFSDMSQETSVENFENSDALFMRNQLDRLEQKYASARMTCKLYVNRIPVFVLFFSKQIFAGFGFWYAIDIINVFITIKDPPPPCCEMSVFTPHAEQKQWDSDFLDAFIQRLLYSTLKPTAVLSFWAARVRTQ